MTKDWYDISGSLLSTGRTAFRDALPQKSLCTYQFFENGIMRSTILSLIFCIKAAYCGNHSPIASFLPFSNDIDHTSTEPLLPMSCFSCASSDGPGCKALV